MQMSRSEVSEVLRVPRSSACILYRSVEMGARSAFLWLHVVLLSGMVLPVVSQPGFLSIDCGSDQDYYDNSTGINWVTDAGYNSAGVNFQGITVESDEPIVNLGQMRTLRYFDTPRRKDCYVLPVSPGRRYLIRVAFFYGDWKGGTVPISIAFDIYLNATPWTSVIYYQGDSQITLNTVYSTEAIIYSPGSQLSVCLVRDPGSGPAFISSLELRELATSMYAIVQNDIFLTMVQRLDVGVDTNVDGTSDSLRYPDDMYDRIWNHLAGFNNATFLTGENLPYSTVNASDLPPPKTMADAIQYNNQDFLSINLLQIATGNQSVFATAYFQEIDGNTSNIRGIDYTINDKYIASFNVTDQPLEIHTPITEISGTFVLNFTRASWSLLPPILNAAEIYYVNLFNTSATATQDVEALFALQVYLNLTDWIGDPCLPVAYNWLGCNAETIPRVTQLFLGGRGTVGAIPEEIKNLTMLTHISLNDNFFNGSIPDLSGLVHLQSLDLQNNSLSGTIPSFLAFLPNLTQLNLDKNNLSGIVPPELEARRSEGLNFTVLNNPNLTCDVTACGAALPPIVSTSKAPHTGAIVGGIIGGLVALVVIIAFVWSICTRKRRARSSIIRAIARADNQNQGDFSINKQSLAGSTLMLTLQEISIATKKFSRKLGEGSFGPVYYGKLANGQEVAVKVKSTDSRQGFNEFLNEVDLLSRIHHRNLVSLVGYCEEAEQQILVYVYVSNGTLRDNLYGDLAKQPLSWKTRLDIALNSARGLEYLHTDCNPRIIHRDVKSSNILLDENLVAKVSDFGISKQAPEGIFSGLDTLLRGTPGYVDPEYMITQRLTQKSDVYSFGIVLLEIVSGRHPRLSEFPDGTYGTLAQWLQGLVSEGKILDFVDPSLDGKFSEKSVQKVLSLALSSTDLVVSNRPDMRQVVRALTEAIELELAADPEAGLKTSENTDSTFVHVREGDQIEDENSAYDLPSLPGFELQEPGTSIDPR